MKKCYLYLHVGLPKTGSSSLQRFLFDNHRILNEFGFNYPIVGATHWGANGNGFMRGHDRSYCPNKEKAIAGELRDDKINIISSESIDEMFYSKTPEIWYKSKIDNYYDRAESILSEYKDKYNRFQLKIVIYLRRQDFFLNSLVGQILKESRPVTLDIQTYIDAGMLTYLGRLNVYSRVFGKENIIVRAYERGQLVDDDLVSDFFDIFDQKLPQEILDKRFNQNESICRQGLLIANVLSKINDRPELFRDCFGSTLKTFTKVSNCRERNIFPWNELRSVVDTYEEENKIIAEEYLGRARGASIFNDPLPDASCPSSELSLGSVIEFFACLSLDQHSEIVRLESLIGVKGMVKRVMRGFFGRHQ